MSAHTIKQLGSAPAELAAQVAANPGDMEAVQAKQKIEAVAETFMSRYGGGEGGVAGMEGDVPITRPGQPGGGRQETFQTNSQGAAHVAEAVRELAVQTGVYVPEGDVFRPKDRSPAPGPDIPRQN